MFYPPTKKQIEYAKLLGIVIPANISMKELGHLISIVQKRQLLDKQRAAKKNLRVGMKVLNSYEEGMIYVIVRFTESEKVIIQPLSGGPSKCCAPQYLVVPD